MPPKRIATLATLAILAATFFSFGALAGDVSITGPDTAAPGQMVQLTIAGVTFEDFTTSPPTIILAALPAPDLCVGAYLLGVGPAILFQETTPGTYHVLIATTIGGRLQLLRHAITVGDPPPPPNPNPPTPPDPDPLTDWGKWSKAAAESKIDHPNRRREAQALAGSIRGVLAANAAGVFSDARQLREAVKQANVAALVDLAENAADGRARASAWNTTFDRALADAIRDEVEIDELTVGQWSQLYGEIADGLDEVE